MKKNIITILLILISIQIFSNNIDSLKLKTLDDKIEKIETTQKNEIISPDAQKLSDFDKKMPWIIALIIGVISAFVNIIIAISQQYSNRKSIERQLQSSKETINSQIENAKEIALLDFNSSVKSSNRQNWINSVRDTTSELVGNLESLNIDLINSKISGKVDEFKSNQKYAFEISKLATKLELLLNPNENKTKLALENLKNMVGKIINEKEIDENYVKNEYKIDESKFLKTIKSILKDEWERVKIGD